MDEVYPQPPSPRPKGDPQGNLPHKVQVPSYTEDDEAYWVDLKTTDPTATCECARIVFHGETKFPCKHYILASSGVPLKAAERGLLWDATPCIVLLSGETQYRKRVWGFDQGIWQHALCHTRDEGFIVESVSLAGDHRITRLGDDWKEWCRHIPKTHSTREKDRYKKRRSA